MYYISTYLTIQSTGYLNINDNFLNGETLKGGLETQIELMRSKLNSESSSSEKVAVQSEDLLKR